MLSVEQALAVLTIAFFLCFIVWGRTAGGRAALTRVFGPPPAPRARARRTSGTQKKATVKSRTTSAASRQTKSKSAKGSSRNSGSRTTRRPSGSPKR
jgi:hypothetical protein